MTIQNQEMKEAKKASFDVNAEVPDPTDVSATAPGVKAAPGEDDVMQGSSEPKTKVAMMSAVMAKLGKMKKEEVQQKLKDMSENGYEKNHDDEDEDEDEHEDKKDMKKENMKMYMKKIKKEDINVKEDIAAAFSGSDLSEEFKTKATEIFETAVVSAVNMKLAEIAEQAEKEQAEEIQKINEGLTTKIDEYLDYVVEEWMKENKLAVESGLRSEVTENFLTGLRDLFTEHYVDIPEEKVEVVEELADEVEHLTLAVNEEMQKNIELKKQIEKFEREIAFVEVSEGLTEIQISKFESLAEAVDYDNAESYKEKLETLRGSFFERNEEEGTKKTVFDEEFIDTNENESKVLDPSMQVYSAAISRSVKK